MKIALVGARNFPASHGGLEVVVEALARVWARRGHDVHVFVGAGVAVEVEGIEVHRIGALPGKYTHTASQVVRSIREVRALNADVVSVHGVGPAFPLAVSSSVFGRSLVCVTVHGLDWDREKWPGLARAIFRSVAVPALRNADRVTAVSSGLARSLTGLVGSAVYAIPNGLDAINVSLPSGIDFADESYCVAVSRLTQEKNVASLVRSYSPSVAQALGPLLIVGSGAGSYSSSYEELLRREAHPGVVFLGAMPREASMAIVARSRAFLSASRLEANPMAVLEAVAMKRPLVVSDIDAHREIAGDDAVYVSDNSLHGWSAMLEGLATGAISLKTPPAGAAASWDDVAARYEAIFSR